MVTHTCPICSRTHEVPAARAQVAYGRQFTCSPDCEVVRRRRMRRLMSSFPSAPRADGGASEPRSQKSCTPG